MMSENSYLIAQIVAAVCILILVVPAFLSHRVSVPTFVRNAALWAAIVAGILIAYKIFKG